MSADFTHGPLVSIITPTFNRAKLVVEAIDSVVRQEYQSWEMIIWDDGSADETPQILRKYQDPRIQYHRREVDHGLACARNQAMAAARGKYLAFLDDDDKWFPHKLTRQVRLLESHREADVLSANFENLETVTGRTAISIDANRAVFSRMKTARLEDKVNLILDGFAENLLRRNFILPSAAIMRKSIYDATGAFNEQLRGAEDREYWWRCTIRGAHFAHDDEVLVQRRRGEDSRTAILERARTDEIKSLYCCQEDAKVLGRKDLLPAVDQAIGNAWENMIRFYLGQGQKRKALDAFKRRCRYGLSLRAVALAAGSLCGPEILRLRGIRTPAR